MAEDVAVVGAGPNGLAAAITMARAGRSVTVYEAADTAGGGARSAALLAPDAITDVCSAVHPFAAASPFLTRLPLADHGLEWVHPEVPLAHPLDDRPAALLEHDLDATATGLGVDGDRWRRTVGPAVRQWERLVPGVFGPLLRVPRAPLTMASFGLRGIWPATGYARAVFRDEPAKALLAGNACHAKMPLSEPLTAAFGVLFAAAGHTTGWPVARGGSQRIADALVSYLETLGGRVVTGHRIDRLAELDHVDTVLLDVTPRQVLRLAGDRLPAGYARALGRWRYGWAVYKVDYLLDGPVPWRDPDVARAGTVHVGGTLDEIAAAEAVTGAGGHPERPFLIVAQQSLADPSRVPEGRQVLWAYCHVPYASEVPMGARIDAQIERFAPGFRDRVLARHETSPADLERYDENYVGGDIGGGALDRLQFALRPVARPVPYATPLPGVWLCSSSTPPGGGVHGMCGYHAARAVLAADRRAGTRTVGQSRSGTSSR